MNSRFLSNGAPTRCASCDEPFPVHDGRVEVWRFGRRYFCVGCASRHRRPAPQTLRALHRVAAVSALAIRSAIPDYARLGAETGPTAMDDPRLPVQKLPR
jgi:hypothetical protein